MKFCYAIFLAFITCSATTEKDIKSLSKRNDMLTYEMKSRERYVVTDSVEIEFILMNPSAQDLYFLIWYTPFEGFQGDLFNVMRNDTLLPYQGRMVKRGQPDFSEYKRIAAGDSLKAKINLTEAYDTSKPGEYRVEYIKNIADVVMAKDVQEGKVSLPRRMQEHTTIQITGGIIQFTIVAEKM